ncbi:MAG: membrane fusion protein (multidrug efflux system) [Polaribacter sp.]|jgi:membrane fusion protein (multidrug efflux system)
MLSRQTIISFVLSLVILLLGAGAYQYSSSQKQSTVSSKAVSRDIRTVRVDQFPPTKIQNKIEVDGRLSAYEKINVAAEVQGKLLSTGKTWKQGSSFSKGSLLFQVKSKDDEYNLKAQRSMLYNQITQIMPDLKFDYPEEYEKWLTYLHNFDEEQNVKALPKTSNQKAKYFIGGKTIQSQYYTIKSLEEKMNNYRIYAPFNGVFISVNNYPGSLVSPGANLGQIMNTYNYELVSPITMDALKYVSVGQKVELFSDEMGKNWKGTVNRTSKQIDQQTQSVPVYITVSGQGLRDGMYLKGKLGAAMVTDVSILPKEVLVNQNEVFLLDSDTTLSIKEVIVINFVENKVYVKGLEASDRVVISSSNNLFVGQKVKL